MKSIPKVSVIIPAYNAGRHIESAIDSVLNQTYRSFEVVVVDDGSTDETAEKLRKYGSRIRHLTQSHHGQARAVNLAIRAARGQYLAYHDADDLMAATRLEEQVRYLDEHIDVDVVYSDMFYTTSKSGTVVIKSQPLDLFHLLQRCYISRITVMHRQDCVSKVGMFNESLTGSDDWDMWVRMSERCKMAYIDQPLAEYRIHGSNTSFKRGKRLNHYRWTRMVILQNAYHRRGKPVWLLVMCANAEIQWILGKTPFVGENMPRFWALVDRAQATVERALLHRASLRGGWRADCSRSAEHEHMLDCQ